MSERAIRAQQRAGRRQAESQNRKRQLEERRTSRPIKAEIRREIPRALARLRAKDYPNAQRVNFDLFLIWRIHRHGWRVFSSTSDNGNAPSTTYSVYLLSNGWLSDGNTLITVWGLYNPQEVLDGLRGLGR